MPKCDILTIIATQEANNNYSSAIVPAMANIASVAVITAKLVAISEVLMRFIGAKFPDSLSRSGGI